MIKYLEDLRFIIGLFFGIVSLILLVSCRENMSTLIPDVNLNCWVGSVMLIFAVTMLALGYRAVRAGD